MSGTPTSGGADELDQLRSEVAQLRDQVLALRAELLRVRDERDRFERALYDLAREYLPPSETESAPFDPTRENWEPFENILARLKGTTPGGS